MSRGRVLGLGTIVVAALGVATGSANAEPRAVVELFTSQACSSCPAADHLLGELRKDPSLLAVSLPINYWDYLGWKDTLADPRNSARQKAYSLMRGDRDVYTPQAVVNGIQQVLGSDRGAIEQAVAATRHSGPTLSVPLAVNVANGKVSVRAGDSSPVSGASGEVWLWGLATSVAVEIGHGENHGRTVTYFNVVRRWLKLGEWSGMPRSWTVPLAEIKGDMVDTVAAIVQTGNAGQPGAIVGASVAPLR